MDEKFSFNLTFNIVIVSTLQTEMSNPQLYIVGSWQSFPSQTPGSYDSEK